MGSFSVRSQRTFLISLSIAGIAFLVYWLFSDLISTKLIEHSADKPFIYLDGEDAVFYSGENQAAYSLSMFKLFHYVLPVTLLVNLASVFLLVIKPSENSTIIKFCAGVIFSSWCLGLYFIIYDLEIFSASWLQLLSLMASIGCVGLAMHHFLSMFLEFPTVYTDERRAKYQQRISHFGTAYRKNRKSLLVRFRRAILYWQVKSFRKSLHARKKGKVISGFNEMFVLQFSRLYSLIVCLVFMASWAVKLVFDIPEGLNVLVIFFVMVSSYYPLTMVLDKTKMDYDLGGDEERKKVLWVYIGLFGPLIAMFGIMIFSLLLSTYYPPLGIFAINALFTIFPPVWFSIFVLCMMIAIFFFGAIDPKKMLKASTLYTLLGLLLTVIFVSAEQLASPIIINYLELPGNLGSILAGIVVAFTFNPLKEKIDKKIGSKVGKLVSTN